MRRMSAHGAVFLSMVSLYSVGINYARRFLDFMFVSNSPLYLVLCFACRSGWAVRRQWVFSALICKMRREGSRDLTVPRLVLDIAIFNQRRLK